MDAKPPFESFSFTMTDQSIGRRVFRMQVDEGGETFSLHVESGTASNPKESFDRTVARSVVERMRDKLAEIGAFSWEGEYGDSSAPGTRRWNMGIVFQEGVFSVQSFGGSDTPEGFADLLEMLYQMDMPRPASEAPSASATVSPGAAPDFSAMFGAAGPGGPDPAMLGAMQEAFAQMQSNPAAFTRQMKDEFSHLPYEQQEALLDMLASSGMATRDWWERFLRG